MVPICWKNRTTGDTHTGVRSVARSPAAPGADIQAGVYAAVAAGAAGLVSALAFYAPASGGLVPLPLALPLALAAAVPLYAVGMAFGQIATPAAAGVGVVGLWLLTGGPFAAFLYAGVAGVPPTLAVAAALSWRRKATGERHWLPVKDMLSAFVVVAMAAVLAVGGMAASGNRGAVLLSHDAAILLVDLAMPFALLGRKAALVAGTAPILLGLFAMAWVLVQVLGFALGLALAIGLGKSRRPAPDLTELRYGPPALWAFGVAALAATVGMGDTAYIGLSAMLVLILPLAASGIAMLHGLAGRPPAGRGGIGQRGNGQRGGGRALLAFAVMALLVPPLLVLPAALGLIDQFASFGRRVAPRRKKREY